MSVINRKQRDGENCLVSVINRKQRDGENVVCLSLRENKEMEKMSCVCH